MPLQHPRPQCCDENVVIFRLPGEERIAEDAVDDEVDDRLAE